MKFCMVVVDLIPHNSTEAIVKMTLEKVVAADTSSLSRKTAQSLKGNVDVEPPTAIGETARRRGGEDENGPVRTAKRAAAW